ncbi:MAG: Mur ligase domain-containing protein [Candidatus Saccharimonadales bacterium]
MNIYFSGIGGVGIGPLAEIAHDAGYSVAGSDPNESLIIDKLISKNIPLTKLQDGKFMLEYHNQQKIDWFVHTAALTDNHPELLLAKKLGIKISKRDELLAYIIKQKNLKLIAVSGTHGKTTTTGMLIWVFKQLGIDVSYSIGTTMSFGPSGKYSPKSEYFVYECDEFDKNFLHFRPYLSLITSIDYDHPDTYPTEKDYLDAFYEFALNSSKVFNWNDQHPEIFNDLTNVDIVDVDSISKLNIHGNHNVRNANLVKIALKYLGVNNFKDEMLENFPGVDRRFEKIANNLYSDYAHHPTEIAATMQLAREISNHVILVYQPHQNTRQYDIKDKYLDQFELAEKVYWLPTYLSRENPQLRILKPEELIENITNKKSIRIVKFDDDLWNTIKKHLKEGKLVLIMGAGEIDNWIRKKLAKDPIDL